jgi:hypothetical protein
LLTATRVNLCAISQVCERGKFYKLYTVMTKTKQKWVSLIKMQVSEGVAG